MVTADQVWAALDEIPDPEIPVISLVELGVVRDVRVDETHVYVALAPTFLGCPALDMMRRLVESHLRELGVEPDVEVLRGDDWTTERITEAGREKLRAAGFAPPTRDEPHCPHCGSAETRLENLFGPTPCRSIRYCESCRKPFEQFKTI
jgi:ring-1,2-phenylacetyl-CoA epoxidase subunit PaaD